MKIIVCILLSLMLVACSYTPKSDVNKSKSSHGYLDVSEKMDDALFCFNVDHQTYAMKPGDIIEFDYWNDPYQSLNEAALQKCPVLYKGISLGTKIEDVLDIFGIEPGYALIDREMDDGYGDGETDVVQETYQNLEFFNEENVLDCCLIFAIVKEESGYFLLPVEQLETCPAGSIYFRIDFVGEVLADDEEKENNSVISLYVKYIN